MFKKVLTTALFTIMPIVSIQANSNDPFESVFKDDPFFKDFQQLQSDMDRLFESFHKKEFIQMPVLHVPNDL